jgi:hypothetical protein
VRVGERKSCLGAAVSQTSRPYSLGGSRPPSPPSWGAAAPQHPPRGVLVGGGSLGGGSPPGIRLGILWGRQPQRSHPERPQRQPLVVWLQVWPDFRPADLVRNWQQAFVGEEQVSARLSHNLKVSDRRRNTPKSSQKRSESLCAGLWVHCLIFWAWCGPAFGPNAARNRRFPVGSFKVFGAPLAQPNNNNRTPQNKNLPHGKWFVLTMGIAP